MATSPREFASHLVLSSDATTASFQLPALDNTYGALLLGASFGFMWVSKLIIFWFLSDPLDSLILGTGCMG